jgi:hypothetical protein
MIFKHNDGYPKGIAAMEEPMYILAIHGSPSMKRGKTYPVLERLLKGAEKAGAITEVVLLRRLYFSRRKRSGDVPGVLPAGSRLRANVFRTMIWRN